MSVLTLAVLLLWPRLPGRTGRLLRKVPTALVAVATATAVAAAAGLVLPLVDLPSWRSHALAGLPEGPVLGLVAAVLTTTLVCSVQSLLGAVAVDKLAAARPASRDVVRSDLDRELLGQGAANVVSGSLGGLPVAGVAVRSTANVHAGAVSRNSTMAHGVLVVAAALLLVPLLELIPLAALAALVMAVGVQMVSLHHIRTVTRHREVMVYAVTTLGVVSFGVLEGVALGIAVAVGVALHRLTRTRITHREEDGVHQVHVRGQLTFLAVPRLSRALHLVPQGADVVVSLDGSFMDHAAYETLQDWQNTHTARGGTVEITGRRAGVRIAEPAVLTSGPAAETGAEGVDTGDCRCRPWTAWRNHQCDRPASGPDTAPPPGTATAGNPATAWTHPAATEPAPAVPDGTGTHAPARAGDRSGSQLVRGLSTFQRRTAPLVRGAGAAGARRTAALAAVPHLRRLPRGHIDDHVQRPGRPVRGAQRRQPRAAARHRERRRLGGGRDRVRRRGARGAVDHGVRPLGVRRHAGAARLPAHRLRRHAAETLAAARRAERGAPARRRCARATADRAGPADDVEQLCLTNVIQQLEHLRAHESVARALRDGALELHGLYFHVG